MNLLGGRGKNGSDDVQSLADEYGKMLDEAAAQAKKEFEKA
jgi:ElaB/YqjD/DUF883 family membrane-anchored ribosome-binding protein